MRKTTKLIVALVAMLTIGAGAAFGAWSSSQTGSCVDTSETTLYPWKNWTEPDDGLPPGAPPDTTVISGDWNDLLYYLGSYEGELDSTTTEGLNYYRWYSGTWNSAPRYNPPPLGGNYPRGNFWLRVNNSISPSCWNGEWCSTGGTQSSCNGTMSGANWGNEQ